MKTILQTVGLFAGRKTNHFPGHCLTRYFSVALLLMLLLPACHGTNGQHDEQKNKPLASSDSASKPKVNIKVNRRYDDKGNLVGFDSTYSSYYSNVKGDTAGMDTLMHSFDRYFKNNHASFFNDEFKPLFFEDSLRYPDFFHRDFFLKRYELNDQYMRNMMHEMDSIKNKFYHEREETKNSKRHG
jgi:hypothetical protein